MGTVRLAMTLGESVTIEGIFLSLMVSLQKICIFLFVCESVHHDQDPYSLFWQSREKIYGDTLPWSLWYRLRLQEPQESVPLDLVLLTHEARLHILSNVVSHARPVVPPLLQALVVHIDDFLPNLAETSVQNVLWRVLLFQLWCNFTAAIY